MRKGLSVLLLLLLACIAQAQGEAHGDRVRIVATDAYVFKQADGRISGPALDLTEAVLTRAGLEYSLEVAPWARAYRLATTEPNVLLYTLGRTPEREREHNFQWVGETFPLEFKAYRLKERQDIVIRSTDDLRKYRISVVRDAVVVPYLHKLGLSEGKLDSGLQFIPGAHDHWPKLEHGRVDLFVATNLAIRTMCLRGDLDCRRIAEAWTFTEPRTTAYLAYSAGTPNSVVQQTAAAYQAIRKDGSYDRLMTPFLTAARDPAAVAANPTGAAAAAPPIHILATEPKITRSALDFAEAMLNRAGLSYTVDAVPWSRAYNLALEGPDVLLFTIARTPERERQFRWIGEMFPIDFQAYRLKERTDVVIRSPQDLLKYRLSAVSDSSILPYLRHLGVTEGAVDKGLQLTAGIEGHWPKLINDRIDLFVSTSYTVASMCADGDLDCDRIEPAWTFDDFHTSAWLAFSAGTTDATVARAAAAYRRLREDGSFDRIMTPLRPSVVPNH
jgi:polar amino acid transport system substrate-binding protein